MDKRGGLECESVCVCWVGVVGGWVGGMGVVGGWVGGMGGGNRLWSSIIRIMEPRTFELWSFLDVTDLWISIIWLWFSTIEF